MALRGWGDSLVEGLQAADSSLESKARRAESGERVKESQQRQAENQGKLEDQAKARVTQGERASTLQLAGQKEGVQPFEVYEQAANIRLQAGDMEGYEDFSKKGAAQRAQWLTKSLQDAYRRNDIAAGLRLLNEGLPDGNEYDFEPTDKGGVVAVVKREGKELGRMPFASTDDLWAHVQNRLQPGDIYARIRQKQIDEREGRLTDSKIAENNAGTFAKTEQGQGFRISNEITQKFGPQYEAGKVQLVRAQAGAAGANAAESSAGAELKRTQATSVRNGTGLDGTGPKGMGTNKLVEELVQAYFDPVKRTTLSPAQVKMAEQELEASGRSVVRRPGAPGSAVPGQAQPGVPSAKDYSSLWK